MVEHLPPCIRNIGVTCDLNDPNRDCSKCGWNPVVGAARSKKILEKFLKEVAHDKN